MGDLPTDMMKLQPTEYISTSQRVNPFTPFFHYTTSERQN